MERIKLVPLNESHRHAVIQVLNYYIENSTAAYRDTAVTLAHYDGILENTKTHPGYAVVNPEGLTVGFATLEPAMKPSTFFETAEATYFLDKDHAGKGIGSIVVKRLEKDAKAMGIKNLIVQISDDNRKSIDFHAKNGFKEYGRLKECWTKFGKHLGVVYMEKRIDSTSRNPAARRMATLPVSSQEAM